MRRFFCSICVCLAVFVAFGFLLQTARGQSTSTGMIVGVVTDASNAIVPNATVTITLKSTGTSRSTVTDNQGRYVFADVDPGTYDITVSKTGFSSTVISNQVVQIGLQLTENAKMQLGSVSTTVTVTEQPGAELQTVTPTVGTTLSGAIILNLPNQGRDASTLAILSPGQNINGSTGGETMDQNSFQLDGGYATDDMSGDNGTYIKSFGSDTAGGAGLMHTQDISSTPSAVVPVPVASVEEFKISTANQTADFNGGGGSQVQLVTKRGTKTLHGSVYEYYLDNNFGGANTWDNNSTGTAQPSSHFSRFGASAGGEIPHSNFLGGNWFLFGNYEGYRFPNAEEFERAFPLPSLEAGIIHIQTGLNTGMTINVNPTATVDPGCGSVTCNVTAAHGFTPGASIPTTMCASGPCDPRGLGVNPVIQTLWKQYLPTPNDCSQGDGLNYCGYKGAISLPESSNFGVARIDHDFAKNWHFNGTYHYYKLQNTVDNQWDIGGFFPGDTAGQYAAIRTKPQEPWLYTAGLTTDVTPNVTNDVHFSYTRNWWAYGDPGGPPNVAGFPAALQIGGENNGSDEIDNPIFAPYNTDNQDDRTRYWDGHDFMYRDDVTWIKGNHLFQLGGTFQRNVDTHNRNDNGAGINTFEQYRIGGGVTDNVVGDYNMDLSAATPAGITGFSNVNTYQNLYSMVLGIVQETHGLYSRAPGSLVTGLPLNPRPAGDCAIAGVAATADCTSSPSLTDTSVIPTYNLYWTDSWHMKPTFSLNYGLGYTVEMPPYSTNGGIQTVMVDQNNNILSAMDYLNDERAAALQGNAYAPLIGFSAIRNVNGHSHYPYNPFFGGLAPRVGFAWNIRPDTVVRAGYSRIYGRLNGVDPILVPMLTPGLLQPVTCAGPTNTGACSTSTNPSTAMNAFRVGTQADGVNAPLPAPSANLPQPWYPGFNDVAAGAGETIDPNFKPDRSDEFTVSVQHQFGPKILAEVGYIGRIISNESEYYSLSNVPYMMTEGGQTFANAWAQVMEATNYGTNLSNIPVQPFFETALGGLGSNYCSGNFPGGITGLGSCTAEFVAQNSASGNMQSSLAYNAWNSVSTGNFWLFNGNAGRSSVSDPIATTCATPTGNGCGGQMPSIDTTVSNGFGNYNAGYLQLTTTDWHGLTMKSSFQYSNALGTVNVLQASSAFTTVDPFNQQNMYGPQTYNEKFNFNFFFNYAEPFYKSQQGVIGHLLGGWNFSPLFTYGSGFPIEVGTNGGADDGSFGEGNPGYVGSEENGVITQNLHYGATEHAAEGAVCGNLAPAAGVGSSGFNVFSNPDATCPGAGIFGDPVRLPVLGLDGQIGGGGPLKGLPFWNLDMGINKNIHITEKFSGTMYFDFTNVLNHMQPNDPALNIFSLPSWGVLGGGGNLQGNTPRQLQLGVSIDW